jgi:hypothetical protein
MSAWDQHYVDLVRFKDQYGHCKVPQLYKDNPTLGLWVRQQRVYRRKGTLPFEKIELLDKLGFVWEARRRAVPRSKWEDRFEDLQLYKKKHGHTNVPANSIEYSTLARWVILQRNLYRQDKLLAWKQKLLEKEGFEWGREVGPSTSWEDQVAQLSRFKDQKGHCWVSRTDKNHKDLGRWLAATRGKKLAGQLSFERFSQLARLGVLWRRNRKTNYTLSQSLREFFPEFPARIRKRIIQKDYWKKMYDLLCDHIKKYGNGDFKEHPPENAELAVWAKVQRTLFASGRLKHEHEVSLNRAGFSWILDEDELHQFFKGKFGSKARNRPASLVPALDKFRKKKNRSDDAWGRKFAQLYDFKKLNGHLKIPTTDPAVRPLYQWLFKQRQLFKKGALDRERSKTLKELGALGFSTPIDLV